MLLKRYFLYLIRWQLSTPILALCVVWFTKFGATWSTVIANLIGGVIFFWIDRFIFTSDKLGPVWSVRENVVCSDCGAVARGYRLVFADHYDKRKDPHPKFRCETCSRKKTEELRLTGVEV